MRTRKQNIKRLLRWFIRERKLGEMDIAAGLPALEEILDDEGEMDFDDIVRAFDWLGVDLVAVPRTMSGETRSLEWFLVNAVPYDDGGKHPEKDAMGEKRRRQAKERWNGRKRI